MVSPQLPEADSIDSFSNDVTNISTTQGVMTEKDVPMKDVEEQDALLGCECGVMVCIVK